MALSPTPLQHNRIPAITIVCTWLPALLWSGLVLFSSGDRFSTGQTERLLSFLLRDYLGLTLSFTTMETINYVLRKTAHVIEYSVLYWLYFHALFRTWRLSIPSHCLLALLVVFCYAVVDELEQARTQKRIATVEDVALDLGSAAAVAAVVARRTGIRGQKAAVGENGGPDPP